MNIYYTIATVGTTLILTRKVLTMMTAERFHVFSHKEEMSYVSQCRQISK